MSRPEIVSHPLCPHAQRLVLIGLIGGKTPGRDYDLTYLPYATLMQTAPTVSPTGELPVLRIDGELASSNTDAIAEYMDGVLGLGLLPADPAVRLEMRGGERLVATALGRLRDVYAARDRAALDAALDALFAALEPIEARLDGSADPAALTDLGHVALAPMGSLIDQYALLREHPRWNNLPKVKARLRAASEHPLVRQARCPNYEREFDAFFKMIGSAFPMLAQAR